MKILAIETSCDETAAALLEAKGGRFDLLSNVVSSQIKIHAKYGGVVPEVAARKQMEMILPVINEALCVGSLHKKVSKRSGREIRNLPAGKAGKKLEMKKIKNYPLPVTRYPLPDYIAVTRGPGLITSLRVGVETAKTLSYAWNKPLVAVNHLEGHIYSSLIQQSEILNPRAFKFPVLALIVSGGHTQLVLMRDHLKYRIIGETQDDAAGEAFDKVAKILDLGYPGGPIISKTALDGDPKAFDLPRPMIHSGDYNFSFSGLKTAVLYLFNDLLETKPKITKLPNYQITNLCASFQQAVVDVLVKKTIKAAEKYRVKMIVLGGGVAANRSLREQLESAIESDLEKVKFLTSHIKYSGDNAAMIAVAAYFNIKHKRFTPWQKVRTDANLRLR